MGEAELHLERMIKAPIDAVFDKLADIESINEWQPHKGSIRRGSRKTSPGPVGAGHDVRGLDALRQGAGRGGDLRAAARGSSTTGGRRRRGARCSPRAGPATRSRRWVEGETLVRHHARLRTYGIYGPATPVMKRIALRERTAVLDALEASFALRGSVDGPETPKVGSMPYSCGC